MLGTAHCHEWHRIVETAHAISTTDSSPTGALSCGRNPTEAFRGFEQSILQRAKAEVLAEIRQEQQAQTLEQIAGYTGLLATPAGALPPNITRTMVGGMHNGAALAIVLYLYRTMRPRIAASNLSQTSGFSLR